MTTDHYLTHHYGHRFPVVADALVAALDVIEHLGVTGRTNLLTVLLPGVPGHSLAMCWTEMVEPLEELSRVEETAVSLMQERGQVAPNQVDAVGSCRDELQAELATVVSRYRGAGVAQPTTLTAVTGVNPDRLTCDDIDSDYQVCDTWHGTGDAATCPVCFGAGGWQHPDGLIVECHCGLMTGGAE